MPIILQLITVPLLGVAGGTKKGLQMQTILWFKTEGGNVKSEGESVNKYADVSWGGGGCMQVQILEVCTLTRLDPPQSMTGIHLSMHIASLWKQVRQLLTLASLQLLQRYISMPPPLQKKRKGKLLR